MDNNVQEIHKHDDDVTLSKINIAQAFRNLCMDPADAMKLSLKWQNGVSVDPAIVFSLVHGNAAFQHVSNTVAFILTRAEVNIVAYIDDYVIILPKATAQLHFGTLASTLSQ